MFHGGILRGASTAPETGAVTGFSGWETGVSAVVAGAVSAGGVGTTGRTPIERRRGSIDNGAGNGVAAAVVGAGAAVAAARPVLGMEKLGVSGVVGACGVCEAPS